MPDTAGASQLRDLVTAAIGDQYLVDREIGRGGMAVVYAAEDVRLQRHVALKVLPPELAFRGDVRERFVREAQTAARLNHPHIVPIYAVHEHGGLVCFAMALVTGENLAARLLREPRPPFAYVATMLEQIADALAYAHASGVVHRDVKPDNILTDRESGRVMVTDFGIARAAEGGERLTQTGVAVGTPSFMSPEQATGDREIDGRSDLYSLGVLGYLMLTGRLPFEASSTPAMLLKHVSETPTPILALRPDAPPVLVGIVERCLAKRPQDRWEHALAMRDALRRAQRDGSIAASVSGSYRPSAAAPSYPAARPAQSRDAGDGAPRPERDDVMKYGHRSEDWAPRRVLEPAPAPRALPAPGVLPPIPQLPPLPAGADRSAKREWKKANKEAIQDWRVAVREQRRTQQTEWRAQHQVAKPSRLRFWRRADVPRMPTTPALIADQVMRVRKRVKWLGGSAATAVVSFVIGAGFNIDPFAVPFALGLMASVASAQLTMVGMFKLRAMGVSPRAALTDDWKAIAEASDTRTHSVKLQEMLERIAGPAVMTSRFADTVRNAADDRLVIGEITAKLSDADKLMVPDVEPTAVALLERVSALASGLERLDRDLPGNALPQLQQRIDQVAAEPDSSPDRERRLSLLTRQRASLDELVARRDTMQRQLDSAAMALRSLRFDIMKLRTMGVGASLQDVTSATQEAQAISRDLGRVVEAVDEMRRI